MNTIFLSVVVPTFSRPTILQRTLEGLCRQTYSAQSFEVIVVCDGIDSETQRVVEPFLSRLPLSYHQQPKRGVAAARNRGISLAKGELILFIDDDVVPGPALLEVHAGFHLAHSNVATALLGYVTWHPDLHATRFMRWYGEYGALFAFSRLACDRQVDSRYLYSCNVSMKHQLLLSVGGFDESLTVLEDNEIGYRLKKLGLQLFHSKQAIGYHYQTFTFAEACQRLKRYRPGLDAFLKTPAGNSLLLQRRNPLFRVAELAVRMTAPLLAFMLPLVDTELPLPRALYRLMYWYHASYLSFWKSRPHKTGEFHSS